MSSPTNFVAMVCGHTWPAPQSKFWPKKKAPENTTGGTVLIRLGWCPKCLYHYRNIYHRRSIPLNARRIIMSYWNHRHTLQTSETLCAMDPHKIWPTNFDSPDAREKDSPPCYLGLPSECCVVIGEVNKLQPDLVRIEDAKGEFDWPAARIYNEVMDIVYFARRRTLECATQYDPENPMDWKVRNAFYREHLREQEGLEVGEGTTIDWSPEAMIEGEAREQRAQQLEADRRARIREAQRLEADRREAEQLVVDHPEDGAASRSEHFSADGEGIVVHEDGSFVHEAEFRRRSSRPLLSPRSNASSDFVLDPQSDDEGERHDAHHHDRDQSSYYGSVDQGLPLDAELYEHGDAGSGGSYERLPSDHHSMNSGYMVYARAFQGRPERTAIEPIRPGLFNREFFENFGHPDGGQPIPCICGADPYDPRWFAQRPQRPDSPEVSPRTQVFPLDELPFWPQCESPEPMDPLQGSMAFPQDNPRPRHSLLEAERQEWRTRTQNPVFAQAWDFRALDHLKVQVDVQDGARGDGPPQSMQLDLAEAMGTELTQPAAAGESESELPRPEESNCEEVVVGEDGRIRRDTW